MLSTLSQCEFSMGKTLLVYDMNLREMENYEKIYKEIGKETLINLYNFNFYGLKAIILANIVL